MHWARIGANGNVITAGEPGVSVFAWSGGGKYTVWFPSLENPTLCAPVANTLVDFSYATSAQTSVDYWYGATVVLTRRNTTTTSLAFSLVLNCGKRGAQ